MQSSITGFSRIGLITILLLSFRITDLYGCGGAPTSDFNVDNTTPVLGQTVTFTDASTGTILTWNWSFGVGSSPANSNSAGPVQVIYTTTGFKDISLTVTNLGNSDNNIKSSYINVQPTPVPIAGNNGPVCVGTTLSLTASTITGATYSWTGPNGFTSTLQNPTVSLSATTAMSGTYSVNATLYGYTGAAGTTVVTVNSLPASPTGITSSPATICSGSSSTVSVNNPGAGLTTDWYTVSCGGTAVPGGTGVNSLSVSPTTNTIYYAQTRRISTGCVSNTCASVTVTTNPNSWSGATSTNWHTASNWSCGTVPGSGTAAIIPNTVRKPVISTSAAQCASLTLNAGAILTINAGQSLTVNGNLTNSGTITVNAGQSLTVSGNLTNSGTITINSTLASSGSLIVQGTSTGNVTFIRQMQTTANNGNYHYFSSPVGNQTVLGFKSVNTSASKIWAWQETDGTWPEIISGSFVNGQGYNLTQSGGTGSFTFTGTVVNSTSIAATSPYANGYTARTTLADYSTTALWSGTRSWTNYGGGGWNLLGNPFTSAMSATTFLSVNAGKLDPSYHALYVYDVLANAYKYVAPSVPGYPVGTSFGDKVQAGQGFFVLALYDGIVFNFTSAMRVHDTGTTFAKSADFNNSEKDEDPWPGMYLKIKHNEFENFTTVVYNSEMSTDIDPGYDIGHYSSASDVEIFTQMPFNDNNTSYARQALPSTGFKDISLPVGISSENGGEMTITADIVPLPGFNFYLEDRIAGILTDLSLSAYNVTISPGTYGTGRFYIHTTESMVTGIKPEEKYPVSEKLRLWVSDKNLIIKGNIGPKATCEVYDMNGRKILRRSLGEGDMNSVAMPASAKGFFIVRIVDGINTAVLKAVIP